MSRRIQVATTLSVFLLLLSLLPLPALQCFASLSSDQASGHACCAPHAVLSAPDCCSSVGNALAQPVTQTSANLTLAAYSAGNLLARDRHIASSASPASASLGATPSPQGPPLVLRT